MILNFTEIVQAFIGSFLTFSAQGGRGKEKYNAAKIFRRRSEGAAEGGCGGNSVAPESEAKPRRLLGQSRNQQKSFPFLLEEIGRAHIRKAEKTFLLAGELQRAAAGRSGWFRSRISDKMSSSGVVKTHNKVKGTKIPPVNGPAGSFCIRCFFLSYCPCPNVCGPPDIWRNWIEFAVTLPSAFGVPTTTTPSPAVRSDDEAATDFIIGVDVE